MRSILTYHSIDESGSPISVAAHDFAQHVRWLASGTVQVVSVAELLTLDDNQSAVAITFDDGFTNFATTAWPLLRDHGLPVTLFIPTAHVGLMNNWGMMAGSRMPLLPILAWDELARLANAGVMLGAHTRTHADLRQLDAVAMKDEIAGSIEDIVHATGKRPEGLAYPYGFFDERVIQETRHHCQWACTTQLSALRPTDDLHVLPRLDAYYFRKASALSSYGSQRFRSYVAFRAAIRGLRQRYL